MRHSIRYQIITQDVWHLKMINISTAFSLGYRKAVLDAIAGIKNQCMTTNL